MGFISTKKTIENGDLALIWISRSQLKPVVLDENETFQTRFGAFPHKSFIGKKYGSQISSKNGQGFIHILTPTPELWALSLPHRTQIVYNPDASYIVQRLKIRPSTRVIESGTGSGAFTHALARTVSTEGAVYTFEYHQARCDQAADEFQQHGLSDIVHTTHRNVCVDGFDIAGSEILGNSVFLDLPAPWLAIPHLLKPGILDRTKLVTICCFSPCFEQVVKTLFALREAGFQQMEMVENQARRWEGHLDQVRTVDEAVNVLRDVRERRQEGIEFKRMKLEDGAAKPQKREAYNPWGRGGQVKEGDARFNWAPISWQETEIKSHTSYLTFATLPPPIPEKYRTES